MMISWYNQRGKCPEFRQNHERARDDEVPENWRENDAGTTKQKLLEENEKKI